MILKKLLETIFHFFQYKVWKTTLCLLFTFMFTFSFIFLQMLLITKEFIKHENKFNRKVFHDRENSENFRFSEFSYFMKGFKNYIMNISWQFTQWNTIMKYVFHEMLWEKYFTVYPGFESFNQLNKMLSILISFSFVTIVTNGFKITLIS